MSFFVLLKKKYGLRRAGVSVGAYLAAGGLRLEQSAEICTDFE